MVEISIDIHLLYNADLVAPVETVVAVALTAVAPMTSEIGTGPSTAHPAAQPTKQPPKQVTLHNQLFVPIC